MASVAEVDRLHADQGGLLAMRRAPRPRAPPRHESNGELCALLAELGRHDAARRDFDRALGLDPPIPRPTGGAGSSSA